VRENSGPLKVSAVQLGPVIFEKTEKGGKQLEMQPGGGGGVGGYRLNKDRENSIIKGVRLGGVTNGL